MPDSSNGPAAFKAEITVFILVKTQPEWLALSVDQRFEQVGIHVAPILIKHAEKVRLRFYDVEFYSARVTDIWVWEAADHHAYQLLIEDLRTTPMWDKYFQVIEILAGVEDAYATNNNRAPVGT